MITQMHCLVCKDARKAEGAVGDAKRILAQLKRAETCVQHRGYSIENEHGQSRHPHAQDRHLCSTHLRGMCGSCPEIVRHRNEIGRKEAEISELVLKFHFLMRKIKESDKEFHSQVKAELFRALAGRYPKAVRLILDS